MTQPVRTLDPAPAAEVLKKAIAAPDRPFTVADASVASGLSLRETEAGLHLLTHDYRGHLRVSEDGDLVHVFPHGFTKPWETEERLARIGRKVAAGLLGVGRFVVRAWLLVVMVGYALLFVALLIGLTFAGRSNDRDHGSAVGPLLAGLFRMIADALFWTFHPWSPFYVGAGVGSFDRRPIAKRESDVPFYEKVNRFVFGPSMPPPDPHAMRARVLAEIRAKKGRIGLADVMRVTGLPRDQADPLMARLMLDHDGSVEVGEGGGIVYRFEALRRTAESGPKASPPPPAWQSPPVLPPLTGNSGGANAAIVALNAFNALAASFVLANGLTLRNLYALFEPRPRGRPPIFVEDGVPIALGLVPLAFSVLVLALPAIRAAFRARKAKSLAEEKARLAVLREVLARAPNKEPVPDEALKSAWRIATGEEPSSKEITRRVVELGGDVDVGPEGEVRYRFVDLEAEAEALEEERAAAPEAEARLGKIVFTSET